MNDRASENLHDREYGGPELYCPFCGKCSEKFLPTGLGIPVLKEKNVVGGGYRLNAMCPHCHSIDRERLIFLYLKKEKCVLFSENLKVLHVAPEMNLQKVLLAQSNIEYLSVDLNSPLATVRMDITDMKYEDDSFDVVICNHVLEHISDDRKAMAELYRVLKPNGWAILQVPISLSLYQTYEDPLVKSPEEREKIFGQNDHVRIYAKDYQDRLKEAGFSVEIYSFAEGFGESAIRKYGLIKDENIYICSKTELREESEYDPGKFHVITPQDHDFSMLYKPGDHANYSKKDVLCIETNQMITGQELKQPFEKLQPSIQSQVRESLVNACDQEIPHAIIPAKPDTRRQRPTRIAAITIVYNEALILPYFLRHYEYLDEIHVLYETDSTDETLQILKKTPNVIIKSCHIEGGLDNLDKVSLINDTLSKIKADWVYVLDSDEFIFPPNESPHDFLSHQNHDVIRAAMYQVFRHRTDTDLDPSLSPIPQRIHGEPDVFSTVEKPNRDYNAHYIKPVVVRPSSGARFLPGNHDVEG